MTTGTAHDDDNVIALRDYVNRARGGTVRRPSRVDGQSPTPTSSTTADPVAREPATLVLSVYQSGADDAQYRIIGINDALPITTLYTVLDTCFECNGDANWALHPTPAAHATTTTPTNTTDTTGQRFLHELLAAPPDAVDLTRHQQGTPPGDTLHFHLEVAECFLRDHGPPDALCVGGDEHVDLDSINAALTGAATTQHILAATRPVIRSAIERSGIFDFVPLLQALDLDRDTHVDPDTWVLCRSLPAEKDPAARDAAVAEILAQAALVDGPLRADIVETMMAAIGWVADDGTELTLADIDDLAHDTLHILDTLGITGDNQLSSLERLELCRAIIRADGE